MALEWTKSCEKLVKANSPKVIMVCQNELAQKPDDENLSLNLGLAYHSRGDYVNAAKWYTKSANQSNVAAQNNLAFMYQQGKGVKKDYAKALEWYTKSANQGAMEVQYELGVMYYSGHGISENLQTAKMWFGKACDGGHKVACQYR